jgi:hypothetical protein
LRASNPRRSLDLIGYDAGIHVCGGSFGTAVMAEIERIAITLPSDMASVVRGAVEGGN